MRVSAFVNKKVYSSNVYLLRGDHNALDDVNTLIDTGSGDDIIEKIEEVHTGVGKKRVERVILTHSHFDHTGGVQAVKKKFGAEVYAFSRQRYTDHLLKDGDRIKIGDEDALVFHVPDHSHDSVCLLCAKSKVAFTGDMPVTGLSLTDNRHSVAFNMFIRHLFACNIHTIFPGHGKPVNVSSLGHYFDTQR